MRAATAVRARVRATAAAQGGFSLIEVVVALMLMILVMTSTAGFFVRGLTSTRSMQQRQAASALAAKAIETARAQATPTGSTAQSVVANKEYTVVTTPQPCWVDATTGECEGPAEATISEMAANAEMVEVTVAVTWERGPAEQCPPGCSYSVTTLRAAPSIDATSTITNLQEVGRS